MGRFKTTYTRPKYKKPTFKLDVLQRQLKTINSQINKQSTKTAYGQMKKLLMQKVENVLSQQYNFQYNEKYETDAISHAQMGDYEAYNKGYLRKLQKYRSQIKNLKKDQFKFYNKDQMNKALKSQEWTYFMPDNIYDQRTTNYIRGIQTLFSHFDNYMNPIMMDAKLGGFRIDQFATWLHSKLGDNRKLQAVFYKDDPVLGKGLFDEAGLDMYIAEFRKAMGNQDRYSLDIGLHGKILN